MVDANAVQAAVDELATRLVIPADLITVHRSQPGRGRSREYRSIRYGAFLLTYGPFERFFNRLVEWHGGPAQGLAPTPDTLREKFRRQLGVENLTRSWRARARVAPQPDARARLWRWTYIENQVLRDYLRDARRLRHLLAHGADPRDAPNEAGTLYVLGDGTVSVNLMWAEGFLQVVEDLAALTALDLAGREIILPSWPEPIRSDVSAARPPAPY